MHYPISSVSPTFVQQVRDMYVSQKFNFFQSSQAKNTYSTPAIPAKSKVIKVSITMIRNTNIIVNGVEQQKTNQKKTLKTTYLAFESKQSNILSVIH